MRVTDKMQPPKRSGDRVIGSSGDPKILLIKIHRPRPAVLARKAAN